MNMSDTTRHETLVGLHVTDHDTYAKYRAAMTPLLEAGGGFFRYDFTIDAMLKGERFRDRPASPVFAERWRQR